MKVLITGSSGFVGSFLSDFFIRSGHQVTGIDVMPAGERSGNGSFRFIRADTSRPGTWQEELNQVDAVVNLAGKNIFTRWTRRTKKAIYNTRILTARNLVDAMPEGRAVVFCSASAVGYYGNRGDDILKENARPGYDFLAHVCVEWEKEAFAALDKGARVVATRFGVVLGETGGVLAKMLPLYRYFVGGPLGDGRQWFSWIHIKDLAGAFMHVIEHEDVEGPVNFCSPAPVRNQEFSKTLAGLLGRPAWVRVPAFFLRLAAGELGDLVLNSQRAFPEKLLSTGYEFAYPYLEDALHASIQ